MSLWHLKPSTASFKLCSPFPPHLNTLLLVYPTCISGHSRPETMRPAFFSLCMPHNIYKQILSAVPPEHTQTLILPHLTQTATFSSQILPAGSSVFWQLPPYHLHLLSTGQQVLPFLQWLHITQVNARAQPAPKPFPVDSPHSRAQQCNKACSCLSCLLSATTTGISTQQVHSFIYSLDPGGGRGGESTPFQVRIRSSQLLVKLMMAQSSAAWLCTHRSSQASQDLTQINML